MEPAENASASSATFNESENRQPLSNPTYTAITQAYSALGQLPFSGQQGCIVPPGYASGSQRLEGLRDFAAYQTNVNVNAAHMAQYQVCTEALKASEMNGPYCIHNLM